MKISLVIPLFNNEKTLVQELHACEKIMKEMCSAYEIIVSDDKSTDNSAPLLKKHFYKRKPFKILFNKKNLGIAKNIHQLYNKAKYPYIVLFSVDGDWETKDIKKLLLATKRSNADIVIGKRTYTSYSLYRKIISFSYNLLSFVMFQVHTFDAGSIKIFRRELFQKTPIISKSVFFEAEFIIRTAKHGAKIIDIPVTFKKSGDNLALGGKIPLVIASFADLIRLRLTF